jgi:hypothetical protein
MNDDEETAVWGVILVGLGAIVLVIGIACVSLLLGRPFGKYAEETRAQVYDTSRQFQQGTNRDIARYCEQMRTAKSGGRTAVAALIRSTADTYSGPLSPDDQACLAEAKDAI